MLGNMDQPDCCAAGALHALHCTAQQHHNNKPGAIQQVALAISRLPSPTLRLTTGCAGFPGPQLGDG